MEWMDHSLQMILQYTVHFNKKPESGFQSIVRSDQQVRCRSSREGLTFSPRKIVGMKFRKRNEEIEIMLSNKIIPCKESIQFLGITLDSRLNWEEHINNMRAKAKRAYKNGNREKMGRRTKREWENNTSMLQYITPRIKEWKSSHNSCRQHKVYLSRIRIGHT